MSGLVVSLAFMAGMLLFDSNVGPVVVAPVVVAAMLAGFATRSWTQRALVAVALVASLLGMWRAQAGVTSNPDLIVQLNGTNRSINATVIGNPTAGATRTKATLKLIGAKSRTVKASLPLLPPVVDGDVIEFFAPASWNTSVPGAVKLPVSSATRDLFVPSFTVVDYKPSWMSRERAKINAFITSAIDRNVPEPAGSLTLGIVNGDDSGMTESTTAAFRASGMSQITAVSGWNVAIVAGIVTLLLRRIAPARWMTVVAGLAIVWFYAFLVGMEPSVVRAAGMASVFLLAHWRGRPGDLLTALLMTTAAMVAVTPEIRFDIGFQLSVAATLGIVLLLEIGESRPWWQSALAVPFVAELSVAPLLLHHLGTYSLVSPIANSVAAPLVEVVMGGGLATLAGSWVHPMLGQLAGAFTWVPARLIVAIAEFTASLRWSSSTTITMSWPDTMMVYLTLILGYVMWARTIRNQRVVTTPLAAD